MSGTDNSLLWYKVKLRADRCPKDPFNVLDCFGGYGETWKMVCRYTSRNDIKRDGIDFESRPHCVRGDNRKWLMAIKLQQYQVIDLDAYGVPFEQTKILIQRKYKGIVFFTLIQSMLGNCPVKLLAENGITKDMAHQCPTLFGSKAFEYYLSYLSDNGVKSVFHRSKFRKHYGYFELV